MGIELQLLGSSLVALTSRTLRQSLRSYCLPTFAGASIDHLQVVPGAGSLNPVGSDVHVHLPVDVFIVTDADLVAAPNSLPNGTTTPADRIDFVFRLRVRLAGQPRPDGRPETGSVLVFEPMEPDLGNLAKQIGDDAAKVRQQFKASLPAPEVDLRPQLALLGMPSVTRADIVLVNGIVAVRFGPPGALSARLFTGQQWGLFVDGPGVEQLLRSRIEPRLKQRLPLANVTAHYAPSGTVPHVDLALEMSLSVSAIKARVVVNLPCDLSLVPGLPPVLRATINWSTHVFANSIFSIFEGIAERFVEDAIHPADFGGQTIGDHLFVIDNALPAIPLLGVVFRYDSAFGSPDGMTIGGAVLIPGLLEPPFALKAGALGGPTRLQLCSKQARTGSGAPSGEPLRLDNTLSYGGVVISGGGKLCAIEVRTPSPSYAQYIGPPGAGTVLEEASLSVAIPYTVAGSMSKPMTLVIRTPRGVRFVDLGKAPKVVADATGRIEGARDFYIKDCLNVVPLDHAGAGLGWGDEHVDIDVFKTRRLEEPDWSLYAHASGGFVVQLVRANGLDAGELLRFRSATHAIDVVADGAGRAVVPVIFPLSPTMAPALLVRANGRSLEGHVGVSSASFEQHLTLPGRLMPGFATSASGQAHVPTHGRDGRVVHTVTAFGVIEQLQRRDGEVALNPQPLPPVERRRIESQLNPQPLPPVESDEHAARRASEAADRAGIHGIEQVVLVPGFASSGAAVAIMTNGSKLLLDLSRGSARVAGTFEGPIGAVHTAGPWAVTAARGQTAVFRVSAPARQGGGNRIPEAATPRLVEVSLASPHQSVPASALASVGPEMRPIRPAAVTPPLT